MIIKRTIKIIIILIIIIIIIIVISISVRMTMMMMMIMIKTPMIKIYIIFQADNGTMIEGACSLNLKSGASYSV